MSAAVPKPDAMQSALDGKNLPSLPLVVRKLIAAVNAPNTEMRELAALIEQDAGLAARMLRLANSPFYGLSGEVGSIQQAAVVLGFRTIAQLAASIGLIQAIKVEHCEHFDMRQFWATSMRVAASARWLALQRGMSGESAYLAGLLHDIGLPLAAATFPEAMERALADSQATGQDLLALEQAQLGFDHSALSAKLMQIWNVPADLAEAIARYRVPPIAAKENMGDVLHIAWRVTITPAPEQILPAIADAVRARMAITPATITQILAELSKRTPEIDALIHTAGDTPRHEPN